MDTSVLIKEVRARTKMSQVEFAESLGISRSALTQLEAGKTTPSYEVMAKMIAGYGVTPGQFFDPPVNKKLLIGNRTAADVKRILTFYKKNYGVQYNEVVEDKMIQLLATTIKDTEKRKALLWVYALYKEVSALAYQLETDIIDPLKRHMKTVGIALKDESNTEINKERRANTDLNFKIILRDAYLFYEMYEERYKGILSLSEKRKVDEQLLGSSYVKISQFAQERYLHAFFYLLNNVDELDNIEDYFDIEHLWRE